MPGQSKESYDNAGGLSTVAYSDSTPGVTYTYNRLGRTATVARNSITTTLAYNLAGQPLSESYAGGTLDGFSASSTYDGFLRRTDLFAQYASTPFLHHSFGYDLGSRLQTVTDNSGSPAYSATYTYVANSPLVGQITFKQGSTSRMTTTKQFDYVNRLTSISSSSSPAISSSYIYNSANQRVYNTLADGSYWAYTYDSLGQVSSGKKYWADGSPVAGQQFQYTFDDIGNRTSAGSGGDNAGANLRFANYTANDLNQYTQRTVPGYADSLGSASQNATVTLWPSDGYASSLRKGSYFFAELPVSNGNGALWLTLTNLAVMNNTPNPDIGATTVGHQFLPQTPEQYSYDNDGNLLSDGRWNYTWDAENRLVKLTPSTAVGPQISLQFEYDWQGRRIHKQVWNGPNWTGSITNDLKFLYDGWNVVAEGTGLTLLRSYLWGLDLSGTSQGAGGVGGLLEVTAYATAYGVQNTNCFVAYDGNGNVAALVSAADGTITAQYEYGPFGEVIRATGPMAKTSPFRFSTKYQDDETDLLYYGYRYYNACTGRWINRDPIAELGGLNIQEFANNEPEDHVDALGRLTITYKCPEGRVLYSRICSIYNCQVSGNLTPTQMAWLAINAAKFTLCASRAAGVMNLGCFFSSYATFVKGCESLKRCFELYSVGPMGPPLGPPLLF